MKSLSAAAYGGWEVLEVIDTNKPSPSQKQVLVSVEYAGIESAMLHLLTGTPSMLRLGLGFSKPRNQRVGQSFSGTVVELGSRVEGFEVGDRVYGVCDGSFAEFAIAKPSKIAKIPAGLSFDRAAGIPVSAVAAHAAIAPEDTTVETALVVGASGGVGGYLCQLLLAQSTDITATSSPKKKAQLESLGQMNVIKHEEIDSLPTGSFQRIYVVGGKKTPRDYFQLLSPKGKVVVLGSDQAGSRFFGGFATNFLQAMRWPKKIKVVVSSEQPQKLLEVTETLMDKASLAQVTSGLENSIDAIRRFQNGEVFGRLVVEINSELIQ